MPAPAARAEGPELAESAWYAELPAQASMEHAGAAASANARGHVTFIHGIANKPAADALLALWLDVLKRQNGIDLLGLGVSVSMVYWADVLYADPWTEAAEAAALETMVGGSMTPLADWDARLPREQRQLVERLREKMEQAAESAAPDLAREEVGAAALPEERIPLPWFLKRPAMERVLRDVHHYLFNVQHTPRPGTTYRVRDEIRRRFVTALAGVRRQPHVVVSHSMGTVIAYDCLKRVPDCAAIDTLITIGSPLGLDEIQDQLRPEWTRADGFPSQKVRHWVNVFDHLDPVAGFDPYIANDYQRGGQRAIEDIYEPNHGWWRHSIEKYLAGPLLRGALRRALGIAHHGMELSTPAVHVAREPITPPSESSVKGTAMNVQEKLRRIQQYGRQIVTEERAESLRRELPALDARERMMAAPAPARRGPEPNATAAERAIEKVRLDQPLDEVEAVSFEAIVLPRERPVFFIENDTYRWTENDADDAPSSLWRHFDSSPAIRSKIEQAIPAVGRVELPSHPSIPFGGTAFVVGDSLLMTNRHVAELFAAGLGRSIVFRPGQSAGWDYRRERISPPDNGTMLEVVQIVMIHPYWDMALLRVEGLLPSHCPLTLSVTPPEEFQDHEVAVIGYPAKDWRNDTEVQDRIFRGIYNVKRLQPGKLKVRETIQSFGHAVPAVTHDSSTLGGNSGSAVLHVGTGQVVGLHFAGLYLRANYAVPAYELARDPRVVDAGVNFSGSVPSNPELDAIWRDADPGETRVGGGGGGLTTVLVPPRNVPPAVISPPGGAHGITAATKTEVRISVGNATWTIPVEVSLTAASTNGRAPREFAGGAAALLEGLKTPVVFPRLDERKGYDPRFLKLPGDQVVPLLPLTEAGEKVVARLDDDSHELKYHKFSIVMHKRRRMALYTAANVDWREEQRLINGRRPTRKELTGIGNNAEKWITDERIPESQQLPDEFYTKDGGAFDKGHLTRRDDVCWGATFKDIQMANGDTYHTTNCSPQISGFNQSAQGDDNWGDLENMIQQESGAERVVVFSGPVLSKKDLRFEGIDKRGEVLIQVPTKFWKIVVARGEDGPQAFGFVLEQDLEDLPLERHIEFAVPVKWRRYQRRIVDIEKLLFGLVSLDQLKPFDVRK